MSAQRSTWEARAVGFRALLTSAVNERVLPPSMGEVFGRSVNVMLWARRDRGGGDRYQGELRQFRAVQYADESVAVAA